MKLANLKKIGEKILDILFPKFCLGCGREGGYLCEDCLSLIEITPDRFCPFCSFPQKAPSGLCPKHQFSSLAGLDFAASGDHFLIKKLLTYFKNPPFLKDLANPLSSLIIAHLQLGGYYFPPSFILLPFPSPLNSPYQPSQQLTLSLSQSLNLSYQTNWLVRSSAASSPSFICPFPRKIKDKKFILVNDIFDQPDTFEEAAKTLKKNGAQLVWAFTVTRHPFLPSQLLSGSGGIRTPDTH